MHAEVYAEAHDGKLAAYAQASFGTVPYSYAFTLTNAAGKVVYTQSKQASNIWRRDVASLPYGPYTLTVTATDAKGQTAQGSYIVGIDNTPVWDDSIAKLSVTVSVVGDEAFMGDIGIKSVIIDGGAQIGDKAFAGCTGLAQVKFLGDATLGDGVFNGTSEYTVFFVPEGSSVQTMLTELGLKVVSY